MAIASPWSVDIACRMAQSGHRVVVVTEDRKLNKSEQSRFAEGLERLNGANISVRQTRFSRWPILQIFDLAHQLKSLCKALDAKHLLTLYGGSYALAAYLGGVQPYSIYWVGSDVNLPGRLRTFLGTRAFRKAALNVVNGRNLAQAARSRFGNDRIVELYIGIDAEFWHPGNNQRAQHLACSRWFEPIYDNETILRAFMKAQSSVPALSLTFTSSGSDLERCRSLASEGAASKIQFLGGVDRNRLRQEVQAAGIYVSMSLSDGTSTALLESMACGCFPILSDIPANREWLDHGCDLELVKPGDAEGLAAAMIRIAADPNRRNRASARNRAVVVSVASSSLNMKRLADLVSGPRQTTFLDANSPPT